MSTPVRPVPQKYYVSASGNTEPVKSVIGGHPGGLSFIRRTRSAPLEQKDKNFQPYPYKRIQSQPREAKSRLSNTGQFQDLVKDIESKYHQKQSGSQASVINSVSSQTAPPTTPTQSTITPQGFRDPRMGNANSPIESGGQGNGKPQRTYGAMTNSTRNQGGPGGNAMPGMIANLNSHGNMASSINMNPRTLQSHGINVSPNMQSGMYSASYQSAVRPNQRVIVVRRGYNSSQPTHVVYNRLGQRTVFHTAQGYQQRMAFRPNTTTIMQSSMQAHRPQMQSVQNNQLSPQTLASQQRLYSPTTTIPRSSHIPSMVALPRVPSRQAFPSYTQTVTNNPSNQSQQTQANILSQNAMYSLSHTSPNINMQAHMSKNSPSQPQHSPAKNTLSMPTNRAFTSRHTNLSVNRSSEIQLPPDPSTPRTRRMEIIDPDTGGVVHAGNFKEISGSGKDMERRESKPLEISDPPSSQNFAERSFQKNEVNENMLDERGPKSNTTSTRFSPKTKDKTSSVDSSLEYPSPSLSSQPSKGSALPSMTPLFTHQRSQPLPQKHQFMRRTIPHKSISTEINRKNPTEVKKKITVNKDAFADPRKDAHKSEKSSIAKAMDEKLKKAHLARKKARELKKTHSESVTRKERIVENIDTCRDNTFGIGNFTAVRSQNEKHSKTRKEMSEVKKHTHMVYKAVKHNDAKYVNKTSKKEIFKVKKTVSADKGLDKSKVNEKQTNKKKSSEAMHHSLDNPIRHPSFENPIKSKKDLPLYFANKHSSKEPTTRKLRLTISEERSKHTTTSRSRKKRIGKEHTQSREKYKQIQMFRYSRDFLLSFEQNDHCRAPPKEWLAVKDRILQRPGQQSTRTDNNKTYRDRKGWRNSSRHATKHEISVEPLQKSATGWSAKKKKKMMMSNPEF